MAVAVDAWNVAIGQLPGLSGGCSTRHLRNCGAYYRRRVIA